MQLTWIWDDAGCWFYLIWTSNNQLWIECADNKVSFFVYSRKSLLLIYFDVLYSTELAGKFSYALRSTDTDTYTDRDTVMDTDKNGT